MRTLPGLCATGLLVAACHSQPAPTTLTNTPDVPADAARDAAVLADAVDLAPDSPTVVPDVVVPDVAVTVGMVAPGVVPTINAGMKARLRAVFLAGQAAGNRAGVFAKIGDSITASDSFMKDFGCPADLLGMPPELHPVIDYFSSTLLPHGYQSAWCEAANAFTVNSQCAVEGWTAGDALGALDPPLADCTGVNAMPLRCELHRTQPSVALIMYGTNDLVRENDLALFRTHLTQVVTVTLGLGVIPVLSTIPPRLDDPALGARVDGYNGVVAAVASAQQVPLWDYHLAMSVPAMINHGISTDGVHPSIYGLCAAPLGCQSTTFVPEAMRYGYNQRNLSGLYLLAKLRAVVLNDGPPDP